MKHSKFAVALVLGLLCVPAAVMRADDATPAAVPAPQPEPKIQKLYDQMMAALETDDFTNFAKPLDDDTKRLLTKEAFESVIKQMEPRFDKGYKAQYLCELKKPGKSIYLWKLSFTDKGSDVLVEMGLKDDKISDFLLL